MKTVREIGKRRFHRNVAPRACDIFVYKVLVSHIYVGFLYMASSDTFRPLNGFRDYLPSEHRAKLMSISPSYLEHTRETKRALSKIQRFVLPYCLGKVIRKRINRREFVTAMFDTADCDAIKNTRERLSEARIAIEKRHYDVAEDLRKELDKAARLSPKEPAHHEQFFENFDGIDLSGRWAQQLVEGAPPEYVRDIDSRLAGIFPDIFRSD